MAEVKGGNISSTKGDKKPVLSVCVVFIKIKINDPLLLRRRRSVWVIFVKFIFENKEPSHQ